MGEAPLYAGSRTRGVDTHSSHMTFIYKKVHLTLTYSAITAVYRMLLKRKGVPSTTAALVMNSEAA